MNSFCAPQLLPSEPRDRLRPGIILRTSREEFRVEGLVSRKECSELAFARATNGRPVAVKTTPTGASDWVLGSMKRELETYQRFRHLRGRLVELLGQGQYEGANFGVFEWCSEPLLFTEIERRAFTPERTAFVLKQIAELTLEMHKSGIMDRDIKPENMFLLPDERVLRFDLGTAKREDEWNELTPANRFVGTLLYLSPESYCETKPNPARDTYAIGIIGIQMLMGKIYFDPFTPPDSIVDMINKKRELDFGFNSTFPVPLANALRRVLNPKPHKRGSLERFIEDMDATISGRQEDNDGILKSVEYISYALAIIAASSFGYIAYEWLMRN